MTCQLEVSNQKLEFMPNQSQVTHIFNEMVLKGIELICQQNRYFSERQEMQLYRSQKNEQVTLFQLKYIVESDQHLTSIKDKYQATYANTVSVLQKYEEYITPYMDIYYENIQIQPLENTIDLKLFK